MTKTSFAKAAFAALLLLLPLVGGCFDYELFLDVRADGTSHLVETLCLPASLAADTAPSLLHVVQKPIPNRRRVEKDGTVRLIEEVDISRLDRLTMYFAQFTISRKLGGLMDLTDALYHVNVRLYPGKDTVYSRRHFPGEALDPPPPPPPSADPAARQARSLLERALGGASITIRLRLPGSIEKAWPVNLGSTRVTPVVTPGEPGEVAWKLPVAELIAENVREMIDLHAEFDGEFAFSDIVRQNQRAETMQVQSNIPEKKSSEGGASRQPEGKQP